MTKNNEKLFASVKTKISHFVLIYNILNVILNLKGGIL